MKPLLSFVCKEDYLKELLSTGLSLETFELRQRLDSWLNLTPFGFADPLDVQSCRLKYFVNTRSTREFLKHAGIPCETSCFEWLHTTPYAADNDAKQYEKDFLAVLASKQCGQILVDEDRMKYRLLELIAQTYQDRNIAIGSKDRASAYRLLVELRRACLTPSLCNRLKHKEVKELGTTLRLFSGDKFSDACADPFLYRVLIAMDLRTATRLDTTYCLLGRYCPRFCFRKPNSELDRDQLQHLEAVYGPIHFDSTDYPVDSTSSGDKSHSTQALPCKNGSSLSQNVADKSSMLIQRFTASVKSGKSREMKKTWQAIKEADSRTTERLPRIAIIVGDLTEAARVKKTLPEWSILSADVCLDANGMPQPVLRPPFPDCNYALVTKIFAKKHQAYLSRGFDLTVDHQSCKLRG